MENCELVEYVTHSFRVVTHRQIEENANNQTAQPIKDQQEKVIGWTRFEMISFQPKWIVVQEVAIQHEMETGGRIQRIVEDARR